MNNRGETSVTGLIVGILAVAMVAFIIGAIVSTASNVYDVSGYDNETVGNYNYGPSLASDISDVNSQVDNLVVDANVFDYFAGVWNKIASPFKTVYQSFNTVNTLTNQASDDLGLFPEFKGFLVAFITLLVMLIVIGIYIGRKT